MEAIPNGIERVDKIIGEVTGILERAEGAAVEKMRTYVEMEPKEGEIYRTLELFADQNFCLVYNSFKVTDEDGKKKLGADYDVESSSETSFISELDEYETKTFDGVEFTDKEAMDFGTRQSEMLYAWLSTCWKAAGGEHSKTPTYFAMDKEYMCHDPLTGEVLEEEDVARKLGYDVVD